MDHELFVAATIGNVHDLRKMADKVNQLSARKQTILHLVSRSGKTECVKYIVDTHPQLLRRVDSKDETALHHAATKGHAEAVRLLLAAAKYTEGHRAYLRRFLGAAFNRLNFIRHVNTNFDSALHLAVRNNHLDVVKLLVKEDPTHTHTKNSKLYTPVYEAALGGYKDILNIILDTCDDAGFDGPDGKTALHVAIEKQDKECVEIIVEKREQMVALTDNKGWTALHYAANHNVGTYILDILVRRWPRNIGSPQRSITYNEDVQSHDMTSEKNPLHIAAYKGHIYILIELMKSFEDWCLAVDEERRNILHMAVDQSHKEMVKLILEDSSNAQVFLRQKDIFGYTPLHLLVLRGCFIPELIKHQGADRTVQDNKNFTPWDLLYHDEEIVAEQLKIKEAFEYQPPKLWFRSSNPIPDAPSIQIVVQGSSVEPSKRRIKDAIFKAANSKLVKEEVKRYKASTSTQIVVAALVATVTFDAGFSIPGYKYNNEFRSVSKDIAFTMFVIVDAVALLLSVSSLFLYFISSMQEDIKNVSTIIRTASALNFFSITVMMVTFATGITVVLPKGSGIAITGIVAAFTFLLIVTLIIFILVIFRKRMYLTTNSDVSAV